MVLVKAKKWSLVQIHPDFKDLYKVGLWPKYQV